MRSVNIIHRPFLQELREEANGMASGNLNPDWTRAYLALADAADRLDAMQARSTIPPVGGWKNTDETPALEA